MKKGRGPGKYDDVCTAAREATEAEGVILIVLGGKLGSGFSAQMSQRLAAKDIAEMLRSVADDIERDTGP